MRSPVSVGAKWTIRFAAVMFVVVSLVSWFHYYRVKEAIARDATLLLELQARELVEELRRDADDLDELQAYAEQHIASADADFKLGIRVFDPDGRAIFARGAFEQDPIPPPERFPAFGEPPIVSEVEAGDRYPYFVIVAAASEGWVEIAAYARRFVRSAREIRDVFLMTTPVVLLVTAALGFWLARDSLRPINRIIETARISSASRLDERVPISGSGDELDELATTLNDMMDRIRTGVGHMRRFTWHAAHELRAPISLLRNRLESALESDRDPGADQKLLADTLSDVDGLGRTVGALLQLAHSESGLDPDCVEDVELGPLLDAIVGFFQPLAAESGIALQRTPGPAARVRGDPTWLHQLFANLVDNAIKFTRTGGRVDLEIEAGAPRIAVHVRDTGIGIPPSEQPHVFETFYRGAVRTEARGAGIGLSLAREIALSHGGDIELRSAPGQGSVFTVRLPAARAQAQV
ncbi:MAG: HAMP domain-containing protein [Deltaproteobacteria bacterium]|nr:MAG: HAMP domain-containing protein [Deltaproteobacteria bacterium]